MKKFRVFGCPSDDISPREIAHRALSLKAAEEGIVLLKNNGILPFAGKTVALFGPGARHTVKGGTGSGDVLERYSVTVEEGLKNLGLRILNTKALDRFDAMLLEQRRIWKQTIETKIKNYKPWQVQRMFDEVIHVTPFSFPVGDRFTEKDLSEAEIALYCISRQAGESNDRRLVKGDYYLSDIETENIRFLATHYPKMVLVINAGGSLDLTPVEDLVPCVVFLAQCGEEGGTAFANLVTGKSTPSGALTSTWALSYEDYPFAGEYGRLSNPLEQNYQEDIFVGYRYFDTFNQKVRYPFGYGLSYTDFTLGVQTMDVQGSRVDLSVLVKNTGTTYPGKKVLQVYVSRPSSSLMSERHLLAALGKSSCLSPGKEETCALTFDLTDLALYDETQNAFMLPPGNYTMYLGENINNLRAIGVIDLAHECVVEQCHPLACPSFHLLTPIIKEETIDPSLPILEMDLSKLVTITPQEQGLKPVIKTPKTAYYLNTLSDKELIALTVGGGYSGLGYNVVPTVAGRTSIDLLKRGIPNINLTDGPAGLRLYPKNAMTASGSPRYIDHLPEDWQWGWLKKLDHFFLAKKDQGIRVYQYMTAFPSAMVQAQTWNCDLLKEIGHAVAIEMVETGNTLWLAPGMNIHRNPLCGRNFEYYSEDPLLSGHMAAAITQGVQSVVGVGVTLKHFCCNNQEDERTLMSANVSERAMREIYLKGFAFAIKHAHPWAVMTAYNKVNGVYMPNHQDLCVKVLRSEWGYEGLVMTDWGSTGPNQGRHRDCHLSGNDLIEPGGKKVVKALYQDYKKGALDMARIRVSAAHVLNTIFESNVWKIDEE